MGLIEQEIKELREMQKKVMSGEITADAVATQLAIFNQLSKRETLLYNIMALNAKHGSKVMKAITNTNLIGNSTAIDIEEIETIVCPEQGGKCISRSDCLDYSGEAKHIDACQKCEQFSITRKRICPQ